MSDHPVFRMAAESLGWRFSPPHDGWINDAHMKPNYERQHEGGFIVAIDPVDACMLSGVDSVWEALRHVTPPR